MTANDDYEHLKTISMTQGRRLLIAGVDLAMDMNHAEIDPAHIIVAALCCPRDYPVARVFSESYGMDYDKAFELVLEAVPRVDASIRQPPRVNDASARMVLLAPAIASQRATSKQGESQYCAAYDIGLAALDAEGPVVEQLIATSELFASIDIQKLLPPI